MIRQYGGLHCCCSFLPFPNNKKNYWTICHVPLEPVYIDQCEIACGKISEKWDFFSFHVSVSESTQANSSDRIVFLPLSHPTPSPYPNELHTFLGSYYSLLSAVNLHSLHTSLPSYFSPWHCRTDCFSTKVGGRIRISRPLFRTLPPL